MSDILTDDKPFPCAEVCIFFKEEDTALVLIESDKSFFFADIFQPLRHKYKGKKRDNVIKAAMRDVKVFAARSSSELIAGLK